MTKFEKKTKSEWKSLNELFESHAGLSFEKQTIFADIIGENSWQFDMNKGTITFGENLCFPVQIIGSLSFNNSSWMWGWANSQSGMPENLLKQSNELKSIGKEKGIKELIDGHFTVEEGFEHKIGMIACGLFNSKSYYCANYGQGTLVITIESDKIPAIDKARFEKIVSSFPQLIGSISINHKTAFINYLIDREFELKIEPNSVEGSNDDKNIFGEFDDQSRLLKLTGKL